MHPGETSQTGEQTGASGATAAGTVTSAAGGGQTVQTGQTGQTGQIGQTGYSQTSQTGSAEASSNVSVTTGVQVGVTVPGSPVGVGHPGIYHGSFVYNRAVPYYVPPVNYNSHIIARHKEFLDARGLSRVRK